MSKLVLDVNPDLFAQLEQRAKAVGKPLDAVAIDLILEGIKRHDPITVGSLLIDCCHMTVYKNGQSISVMPKPFGILVALAKRPNQVIGRPELFFEVWGREYDGDTNLLDVNICSLNKLFKGGDGGHLVKSKRFEGYYLDEQEAS